MARLGGLSAIALGLIVAGAVLVAPGLTVEQRAAALVTISTGLVVVGRLSSRR